jgi:hypothetical protein
MRSNESQANRRSRLARPHCDQRTALARDKIALPGHQIRAVKLLSLNKPCSRKTLGHGFYSVERRYRLTEKPE